MTTINGVDFGIVAREAVEAARCVVGDPQAWRALRDIVANISDSLTADVRLIATRKLSGEFNEYDARIFIEDQKMVARIRLRSVAIIGLQKAEQVWNAVAAVFRRAIEAAIGWTIL